MKQTILLMALCSLSCVSMSAQDDDMYFTPKKASKAALDDNTPAYYVGSNRSVDDYNRRGHFRSRYQQIDADSLSGDVISLTPGNGLYPDSTYTDMGFADAVARHQASDFDDDYRYTRRMSRWDGFYNPWYAGWHSPYWYGGYYDPWYWDYYSWYSPWYYGGWYDPWYYGGYWGGYYGGYWGWHHYYDPWYRPGWGGVAVVPGGTGKTVAGTRNHGAVTGRSYGSGSTRFGSRGNYGTSTSQSAPTRFGSRSTSTSSTRSYPSYSNNNNSYSNSSSPFQGSRSYNTGSSSSSGGSFGGTRSGGGGFSGSGHSGGGGGGHFGGRR